MTSRQVLRHVSRGSIKTPIGTLRGGLRAVLPRDLPQRPPQAALATPRPRGEVRQAILLARDVD